MPTPGNSLIIPNIRELIRWLMEEGAINRAHDLEDRLKKINATLMKAGMIQNEDPICMSYIDMLYARCLSHIDQ